MLGLALRQVVDGLPDGGQHWSSGTAPHTKQRSSASPETPPLGKGQGVL